MNTPLLPRVLRFGIFEVDLRTGELRKHGIQVKLQSQPFQILATLLDHPGEMVTRDALRQKLWPADTFVDFDNSVNAAINRLREALGDSAENPRFVETLPRRGYRFIAPVISGGQGAAPESGVSELLPAAEPGGSKLPAEIVAVAPVPARSGKLRVLGIFAAAAAVAATVALLVSFDVGGLRQRLLARANPGRIQSIAVLPLENLTGDASQDYFVDGMTDALITDLAQISALRVISRTSAMQYRRAEKSLPQIARELNVDALVEGTVVRSGNRVRINAQLIYAPTDRHLWAHAYERETGDVLLLQSDVARAIAGEIRVRLTPQEQMRLATARPVNSEAYEAYLRGRYYWNKLSPEGFERAIQFFQQAIEKDPNYAPAYAGLSDSYRFLGLHLSPPRDSFPKAAAAALKALEIDDTLAEAHTSLAAVRYRYDWDLAGSETEFKRALELSPNYAEGHREYSVYLRTLGRFDEGIAEAKRAKELDPLSPLMNGDVGAQFYAAGRYDQAVEQLRKTLEMDPNFLMANLMLGLAYEGKGDAPKAIAALEKVTNLSKRNPFYLAFLGHTYAVFGQRSQAQKILTELKERSKHMYVAPYDMALIYAGLGEKEQALTWLEKAYEDRSFSLITIGKWKQFDGLRADPRFRELVRRVMTAAQGSVPQAPGETRK